MSWFGFPFSSHFLVSLIFILHIHSITRQCQQSLIHLYPIIHILLRFSVDIKFKIHIKLPTRVKWKAFFVTLIASFLSCRRSLGAVEVVSFTELRLIKSLKVSTLKIIFMPPFFSHSHFMTTFVSGWLSSGNVTKSQCRLLLGAFFSFLSGIWETPTLSWYASLAGLTYHSHYMSYA